MSGSQIAGKAYLTHMLDFSNLEMVDVVILGEDQKNVKYGGKSIYVASRTPNVSTTLEVEKLNSTKKS